jgi:hypothetical protein
MDNDKLTDSNLVDEAIKVLEENDSGRFIQPNKSIYPHQWLWDSCFIAIGLANYDLKRAKIEILGLFEAQWSNGMIPSIILHGKKEHGLVAYDRHNAIWRSWLNPNAPKDLATSGITQPPMLAEAIYQIGQKLSILKRREWYKQVYYPLLKYHMWLFAERDPHHEGLVLQIHPWEIGLDNTPPWMSELNDHLLPWWIRILRDTHLDDIVGIFRKDRLLNLKNQRLTNVEALALFSLQRRLRRKNYQFYKIIDHSLFAIEDITFNSIFIRANQLLIEIANFLGKKLPKDLLKSIHQSEEELDKLWDEYAEEYYSRDFVSHRLLKQSSIGSFMPLYSGKIKKDRASRIVGSLENEHRFGTVFPVPSAPLDSNWFQADRYWQGPTWVNTNWLIIQGLKRYGFNDHADALKESTIEMVKKSGFWEYFNPITGDGRGITNFSWTASLIIDLVKN